jgi:hypothetical protein
MRACEPWRAGSRGPPRSPAFDLLGLFGNARGEPVAHAIDKLGLGDTRVPRTERGLWVVFEAELDGSCDFFAGELGDDPQPEIDPRGDAGARDPVPIDDDAAPHRSGAEGCEAAHVRGSPFIRYESRFVHSGSRFIRYESRFVRSGSRFIRYESRLVAIGSGLIGYEPRLVAIGSGLIGYEPRLVAIGSGLIRTRSRRRPIRSRFVRFQPHPVHARSRSTSLLTRR